MKPSARRESRILAMQALYEWLVSGNQAPIIEKHFLENLDSKKVDVEYFSELLHGTTTHVAEIDQLMTPYLNRAISAISDVEVSVLRLAIYELVYRPDVPYRVVINEALELTKIFGAVEGFKFVNSILDQVSKKVRPSEL